MGSDSFGTQLQFVVGDTICQLYSPDPIDRAGRLPYSLKVLAENLLHSDDHGWVTADQINALVASDPVAEHGRADHARDHPARQPQHGVAVNDRVVEVRWSNAAPGNAVMRSVPQARQIG